MPSSPATRAVLLALALLSAPSCGHEAPAPTRPNVLLISLDSTRRDQLSCYGRKSPHAPDVPTTPHIDRLAAQGVLFEDAYSSTSWTLPAHVSMLTGLPEAVHGVELDDFRLDPDVPTLASALAGAGYRTAGFYSGPYLEPHYGFDKGFERYVACYGAALTQAAERYGRAREAFEAVVGGSAPADEVKAKFAAWRAAEREVEELSHRDVSSEHVASAAAAEIRAAQGGGRPWFVFAHFFDPHYDYVPPGRYAALFDPDYEGTIQGENLWLNKAVSETLPDRPGERKRVISERDLEHVLALYDGELAWTDEQIGRILATLDELGIADDTLVILTSDHGDEFFEHRSIGHRRTLYEEVMRVPMVARWPGKLPAGRRTRGLVSNTDIVPTVLELADVAPPRQLWTRSFAALATGADAGAERRALGKIAVLFGGKVPVDLADPVRLVPAQLVTVTEAWYSGSLKLLRERRWTEAVTEGLSPADIEGLEQRKARDYAREKVRWIDLALHPDEREQDYSADFTDERARAALREYCEAYTLLLSERAQAQQARKTGVSAAPLTALGYAGSGQHLSSAVVTSDYFSLPPPGQAILGD